MDQKIYLIALHSIGMSQKNLNLIFREKENYKEFYQNLTYNSLINSWIKRNKIESILEKKDKINFQKIQEKLKQRQVKIITIKDKNYPFFLKQISNPPYLLYIRWNLDSSLKFSIVWTRQISSYWKKIIETIVPELSNYFTILSWWAIWCDSEAHKQALNSWNKTIAVIWTWIDIDYPAYNKNMYDSIAKSGWAIVSVFSLWEPWNSYNFPIRNEIMAALSVWTLVIEAKEKSWSLITAKLSLDLWKDLFAIPGEIFKKNSEWCNNLIKNWEAKLVSKSSDILEEYSINQSQTKTQNKKLSFDSEIEEKIYNLLILEALTIDEISKKLQLEATQIALKLSMMEINNIVSKSLWAKYEIK